jgi:hypothetical protein
MRSRVPGHLLITCETVEIETPAASAIGDSMTFFGTIPAIAQSSETVSTIFEILLFMVPTQFLFCQVS